MFPKQQRLVVQKSTTPNQSDSEACLCAAASNFCKTAAVPAKSISLHERERQGLGLADSTTHRVSGPPQIYLGMIASKP